MPVFLIGIPMLAGTFWLCRWIARAERARFRLLLGREIAVPPAPERTQLVARHVADPPVGAAWRAAAYAVLRLPLSAADFVLVTSSGPSPWP